MKWSLKIGKILGIDLYLHFTFLLLLVFLGSVTWHATGNLERAASTVAFIATVFACVLLHELGHALVARGYGIKTRDITLLPIGGIARLERMPERAAQEFWVAVAGPAVNLAIALLLFLWLLLSHGLAFATSLSLADGTVLQRLTAINFVIVAFNLMPAFPMDGGRILRAVLSPRFGRQRATAVAASIGQGMAIVFGLFGFLYNPFLVFIAVIVFLGAQAEAGLVEVQFALKGLRASDAMITEFRTLSREDTLEHAVELFLAGSQQDFPVVDPGQSLGMLYRKDLVNALRAGRLDERISKVMQRDCCTVDAGAALEEAVDTMSGNQCPSLPVVHGRHVVGLLTRDHVSEMIVIQAAIERRDQSRAAARLSRAPTEAAPDARRA